MNTAADRSIVSVKLSVPEDVVAFVLTKGGRLYIWPHRHGCCGGGITVLDTSSGVPGHHREWSRIPMDGVDIFLDTALWPVPDFIALVLRRWPTHHVEALWNGCAWVG
jgi:hypothetical protein